MTPEKLKEIILDEINGEYITNWHNIDNSGLQHLLVEPAIIKLIDRKKEQKEYWLVFDEQPGDPKHGYLVVYDEREDRFGLATKSSFADMQTGQLVGLYGSFTDALKNM